MKLTTSGFVLALAAIWSLAAAPKAIAKKMYACPECGCGSDSKIFDQPGNCPSCGMQLIEIKDSHEIDKRRTPTSAIQFPAGKDSIQIPFELLANCPYINVRVNGRGPFLFAVDTGAFTIVAREKLAEMGTQTSGSTTGSGAGASGFSAGIVKDLGFEFAGGLRVPVNEIASPSMAALWPLIGRPFYGDIGYTILRHFVVELDYANKLLTLHDPANYHFPAPSKPVSFTSWANYDPQVDGEIIIGNDMRIPVKLTLDTGGGGTAVTTPLVERYALRDKVGNFIPAFDNGIGGGEPKLVFARLSGLRVGEHLINRPLVALTSDKEGSFASTTLGVNLGGNILRRFRVIIDYSHNQLALEPNSHLNDPFQADASGLILKAEGDGYKTFVVRAVVPDSPALAAGFQAGDVITAINGEPLNKYVLWQVQDFFKKSGTTYTVSVQRKDKNFERQLTLRSLL